jgi:hypothetical protein
VHFSPEFRLMCGWTMQFFTVRAHAVRTGPIAMPTSLIIAEGAADWQLVGTLADLAYEVFLESGILIQPVPVSLVHWRHPERFPRPGFLRNVAREGIVL